MNEFVNRIEHMLCGQVLTTDVANEIRAIVDLCDNQSTPPTPKVKDPKPESLPRKEVISIPPRQGRESLLMF